VAQVVGSGPSPSGQTSTDIHAFQRRSSVVATVERYCTYTIEGEGPHNAVPGFVQYFEISERQSR
jgi:hypothetical protein